jgi:uncharacterized DUF497 family protein
MKSDDFEWDDAKAAGNHRRHKITFEQAREVFADPFIISNSHFGNLSWRVRQIESARISAVFESGRS